MELQNEEEEEDELEERMSKGDALLFPVVRANDLSKALSAFS